jgi:excisionase family DNA binding protein
MGDAIATGTQSWAMPKNDPATALIFEAITRRFGEDVPLKDPERVLHRVQKKIRRLKTPGAKLRSIAQASDELKLHYLETSARIDQMEHNGEIDDPVVCYGYLERIELMIRRLELLGNKVGQISMEAEETATVSTEMMSTPLIPHGKSIEQRDAPEFMDVEELAAFLRVSPSTIYHRTRNGAIPTRRIGARLLFSREEIKAWLALGKCDIRLGST